MTPFDLGIIFRNIAYKPGWRLRSRIPAQSGPICEIWWEFDRPDRDTGYMDIGEGAHDLFRYDFATEESIVRRAFRLALNIEEHECREMFRYNDKRPFDPHMKLI